ncbi:MAG: GNAT family N-acetyltransferase, partial [Longimicrobiales bacterium]
MKNVELRTQRLLLRELRADDFAAVHSYASDREVVRFMEWGPNTKADTRAFLQKAEAMAAARPR